MGRWMQKIQKCASYDASKPPKPSSEGFAVPLPAHFQKKHAANDSLTPEQIGWLAAVASHLEVGTGQLLECGFIDRHDLAEQIEADPRRVAALIKSDPRWYQS
jgi:hypothetical protein